MLRILLFWDLQDLNEGPCNAYVMVCHSNVPVHFNSKLSERNYGQIHMSENENLCDNTFLSIYEHMQLGTGELKDLWSKTTLITSGMGVTGVDPPSCKTSIFFLRSRALSEPIYRNFQSIGSKWPSLKLSINWHIKSQGPMKKCISFTKGRMHPCPAQTVCDSSSFTP